MRNVLAAAVLLVLSASAPIAQPAARPVPSERQRVEGPKITTPKEAFGFNFGDDYQLANYKQIEAYWKTLDKESDRMVLQDMGKTAEGRTQWMAIVTSPENHRKLARYRE